MASSGNVVAANMRDDRRRGLSREQATALASEIEQSVNYLFANCRLEPAADAALHGLLAQLLQGAAALRRDPAADDGKNGRASCREECVSTCRSRWSQYH